ncbi:MAG: hypothetical protein sL5_07070 [Candidatus Mesenet longicola]|uniref:Uncharacterized protein n=1 Tax=Candidatus Mesenet longicola TaxID=1892558 RepID=A0A8J3HVE4_9RICK|nr:MAG: hypothetical protein sGL2_07450 [Candidatus Mesenet longicola]GHM59714.1 MAG: hypothetical protein sL5_07070 [Candidatus Mesenet longicola]
MQWSSKSKEAFTQALNIKFLTTVGSYTNFQYIRAKNCRSRDEICILFSNNEQEKCQEYLEQVTAQYKRIITSIEDTTMCTSSFPFCIDPGRFSTSSRRGVKFKVPLNKRVMNNLYYIFINQLLSFEFGVTNMPNNLELDDDDRNNKKYITGWVPLQITGHPDLEKAGKIESLLNKYNFSIRTERVTNSSGIRNNYIFIHQDRANEAVQRAIEDFPAKILIQYPTKLLTLFNVFYHDLSAKERMSPDCEQFVRKTLAGCVNTAKAQGNIVSFNYDGDSINLMLDERILYEINELYKGRAREGTFSNFINLTQKDPTTITASFNFNLHDMSVIMNKVPCDVDSIENAQDYAVKQYNGIARPIRVMGSSRMPRVANDTIPSSSKQNFLLIPGKSDDSPRSSASSNRKNSTKSNKSDDSALGTSPVNPSYCSTSSELHVNAVSFDSGHGTNVNSPTEKYKSNKSTPTTSPTHSDVTVIPKNSKTSSIGNVTDLDNLEQNPNKVKSKFIRNIGRGKSVPSPSRKVSSAVKIERWQSLDNVKVKV